MEFKVYVPQTVTIHDEYVAALAQRAMKHFGESGDLQSATRGHLIRQAVRDGLIRQFDEMIQEDGSVDLFCDPSAESPLELTSGVATLGQLFEALQLEQQSAAAEEDHIIKLSRETDQQRQAA